MNHINQTNSKSKASINRLTIWKRYFILFLKIEILKDVFWKHNFKNQSQTFDKIAVWQLSYWSKIVVSM